MLYPGAGADRQNSARTAPVLPCEQAARPRADILRWNTWQVKPRRTTAEGHKSMIALLNFIAMVITLYMWVIIISVILSWLIAFNVINRHNQFVYMVADSMQRLSEPALRPIRRILPDLGGLDISPVILILVLVFLRDVVIRDWLFRLAF
jgi:YggT family protein